MGWTGCLRSWTGVTPFFEPRLPLPAEMFGVEPALLGASILLPAEGMYKDHRCMERVLIRSEEVQCQVLGSTMTVLWSRSTEGT
jgi:hypothetical protein